MDSKQGKPTSALITGSARGIGAAIAKHLAVQGIRVAIHYRGSKDDAEQVLAECQKHAPDSIILQGDLTKPEDAQRLAEEATKAFGRLDLLINNIGNYIRKDLLEMSIDEWRDQIESNLYTSFFMCHHVAPAMVERKSGRIINIGYAGGQQAFYNRKTVPYHIAKTGVHIMTRSLAASVAEHGVNVNCIGVGVMENSIRKPADIPAGRIGEFADITNAVDFLIKPESSYINGTQIDVSGAWLPEQIL